jgi:hypothetical protein
MHIYVKCPNGHYYADSLDSCPYCGAQNTETTEIEHHDEMPVYTDLLTGLNPKCGFIYDVNNPPKPDDTMRNPIRNDRRGFRLKDDHVASFAFWSEYAKRMYEEWYNWMVEAYLGEKDNFTHRMEFMGDYVYEIPREIIFNNKVCFITKIETGAFAFCKLDKIVIPSTVTYIQRNAFFRCEGLKELIIPDSVCSIEDGAIRECSDLQSITWRGQTYQRDEGAYVLS